MPSVYEMSKDWSVKELKKEYSRLRDQFQKQIQRLSKVDQTPKIQAFLPGGYKYTKTIKDVESLRGRQNWSERAVKEDWAVRVAELKSLTQARSLSISGRKAIRKDAIESLHNAGFSAINNANFDQFTSFMNFAKEQGVLDLYDSDTVAEAFDHWVNGGIVENEDLQGIIAEWNGTVESIDLFGF